MEDCSVPPEYQAAAEEIRAHLVTLRGGTFFLSPREAGLLVSWLDDGVPVVDILRALERAMDARRKKPSRLPFTLGLAKRHLGKATKGMLKPATSEIELPSVSMLDPLIMALRRADARAQELAEALSHIPTESPQECARQAMMLIRSFHQASWDQLTPDSRAALLTRMREENKPLLDLLDKDEVHAVLESLARDQLRQTYPLLTMATVWDLARL